MQREIEATLEFLRHCFSLLEWVEIYNHGQTNLYFSISFLNIIIQ